MVETKPFKTKLCVLHQRGRCVRETCTFAHGDSELRGFSASFNDRKMDNDLRSKLDRKRSPVYRHSSGRDANGSCAYIRSSPSQTAKRRKMRAYDQMDGPNEFSGGFKSRDGSTDSRKDKRSVSSNIRMMLEDELKQVQYEVDMLFNQKGHLEFEMEERVQEADNLSSRIRDLEAQLAGEKDKFNRINSKINKFINAHVHHSRLQDEIKRSQVQLEQLVGKLGIDVLPMSTGEDELNVNISSEEALESKETAYPVRKQLHNSVEAPQGSKSANMSRGHGATVLEFKRKSLVCSNAHRAAKVENKRNDSARPSKGKQPQLPNVALKSLDPLNKLKASESNIVAPPTSMAAHADDEFVELFEEEKSPGGFGTPKAVENCLPFPLPPLPNVSENNYYQYEDDDENVDVDGLEEPFEDVDIV